MNLYCDVMEPLGRIISFHLLRVAAGFSLRQSELLQPEGFLLTFTSDSPLPRRFQTFSPLLSPCLPQCW
nr:MAG TPA: hypothetical protein [Caudoviricetes sp.]